MPPKTFTCKICGKEVSKRKSWAYEGGRACREHEEVQAAKELERQAQEKKISDEETNKAVEEMQVVSMTAAIRTAHTLHGIPVQVMLTRFQLSGTSAKVLKRIREELDKLGAKMSDEEVGTAMVDAVVTNKILKDAAKHE